MGLRIVGGGVLAGAVDISGFKHALVPVLAASVFVDGVLTLENTPALQDTQVLQEILVGLGAKAERQGTLMTVDTRGLHGGAIPDVLSRRIHGSLYLLPTVLGRMGHVELGASGGCQIGSSNVGGARPVSHMINVLERFGARFTHRGEVILGDLPGGRYRAAQIDIGEFCDDPALLAGPLVSGATKTAILAAATAHGVSEIRNPYRKPDVTELLAFLQSAGVPVLDEGNVVSIEGRPALNPCKFSLISDAIEIMTFIACAIHLRTPLRLSKVTPRVRAGLAAELALLESMGVELVWNAEDISVPQISGLVGGVELEVTGKSIFSDNHPFFSLMLCSGHQPSRIRESVWTERFDYAVQLATLGANLHVEPGAVRIHPGRPERAGRSVTGNDLRSAAVLLLAALGIPGETLLEGSSHLARGYDDLVGKLSRLGASIEPAPGLN